MHRPEPGVRGEQVIVIAPSSAVVNERGRSMLEDAPPPGKNFRPESPVPAFLRARSTESRGRGPQRSPNSELESVAASLRD